MVVFAALLCMSAATRKAVVRRLTGVAANLLTGVRQQVANLARKLTGAANPDEFFDRFAHREGRLDEDVLVDAENPVPVEEEQIPRRAPAQVYDFLDAQPEPIEVINVNPIPANDEGDINVVDADPEPAQFVGAEPRAENVWEEEGQSEFSLHEEEEKEESLPDVDVVEHDPLADVPELPALSDVAAQELERLALANPLLAPYLKFARDKALRKVPQVVEVAPLPAQDTPKQAPIVSEVSPQLRSPAVAEATVKPKIREEIVSLTAQAEMDEAVAAAKYNQHAANFWISPASSGSVLPGSNSDSPYSPSERFTATVISMRLRKAISRLSGTLKTLTRYVKCKIYPSRMIALQRACRLKLSSLRSAVRQLNPLHVAGVGLSVVYVNWRCWLKRRIIVLYLSHISPYKVLNIALSPWKGYRSAVARQLLLNSLVSSFPSDPKTTL
uniref:Uncharacterized protein n=1 Tax=Gervais tombus-like virus TaxID=2716733 RepID=A0A6G7PS41_9TOMB|nr:putative protein 1 [Gervais tombus-like virus]